MKKTSMTLAAATIAIAIATPALAFEQAPYHGSSPYNGSYWNGPTQNKQFGNEVDFHAMAGKRCHWVRNEGLFAFGSHAVCR